MWKNPLTTRDFAIDAWRIPQQEWPAIEWNPPPIVAGDLDAEVLAKAQRNADRAGVLAQIEWQNQEIAQQQPPLDQNGIVVCNPPWGQRLGGRNPSRRLIERLGAVLLRRVPGWRAAVIVPEKQLLAALPLRDGQLIAIESGGTPVWLAVGTVGRGRK